MNRFHVHLNVADLRSSISFYTKLFGAAPTVRKDDYAKWMLENPRVNFAISDTGRTLGVDHLGIQVENDAELLRLGKKFDAAGEATTREQAARCCYAQSNKFWTEDPQGTRWEAFHTVGETTAYHATRSAPDASCASASATAHSCCTPASACR